MLGAGAAGIKIDSVALNKDLDLLRSIGARIEKGAKSRCHAAEQTIEKNPCNKIPQDVESFFMKWPLRKKIAVLWPAIVLMGPAALTLAGIVFQRRALAEDRRGLESTRRRIADVARALGAVNLKLSDELAALQGELALGKGRGAHGLALEVRVSPVGELVAYKQLESAALPG